MGIALVPFFREVRECCRSFFLGGCLIDEPQVLGQGLPLIIWELPWKAIHKIGSGSNISIWYTTETKFRTFLLSVIQAGKVNELRTLVIPQPFQNDPDLLPGHRQSIIMSGPNLAESKQCESLHAGSYP
jgi:hypothetical protein